jgi:hypothetical protein
VVSILICSKRRGGCGYIAHANELRENGPSCPACKQRYCFPLNAQTADDLVDDESRELAGKIVVGDHEVFAIANCGCVAHAEQGIPCEHDLALARERHGLMALAP